MKRLGGTRRAQRRARACIGVCPVEIRRAAAALRATLHDGAALGISFDMAWKAALDLAEFVGFTDRDRRTVDGDLREAWQAAYARLAAA